MKTLYVSDLDGTLFNSKKKVSEYSVEAINRCIEKGMLFAVATARMPYGCDYRLSGIKMNTPGILINGVILYNFKNDEIISLESIERVAAEKVIDVFEDNGKSCFLYTCKGNRISLYYGDKELEKQTQYYSDRALESCEEIELTDDLKKCVNKGEVIYLALTDKKEILDPITEGLKKVAGVSFAYYLNIYNGMYCLEVFSERASKKSALQKLKKYLNCDKTVVFGDNYNDLSMIEMADRSYAPANALDEIKQRVTGVLDSCDEDGVAKFLYQEFEIL